MTEHTDGESPKPPLMYNPLKRENKLEKMVLTR